jgi:hypothetical protein
MLMAKASRPYSRATPGAPPLEQQRLIAEQTAAFLTRGGQIQRIPRGVSGQPQLGGPQFSSIDTNAAAEPAPVARGAAKR